MKKQSTFLIALMLACTLQAAEYHVSKSGSDVGEGSQAEPFQTISKAADKAQAGDTITVHAGVYRERINPPRGGTSDDARIVYQAAPDAEVVIKGSEVITGWENVSDDVWKVVLPNRFFGDFNPYNDLIQGDWYEARQRYHTGAVYLNGHWLKQAARKSLVMGESGADGSDLDLMNVEFLQVPGSEPIQVADRSSQSDGATAVDAEKDGKRFFGPMKHQDWLAFEDVDFGEGSDGLILSTGSPVGGGMVEVRLGSADGQSLGWLNAGLTAEWHHFQSFTGKLNQSLSGKQTIVLVFHTRPADPVSERDLGLWFADVTDETTTIWADFKGANPNQEFVEINVRQSVFYSEEPGMDYITVRGFTLEQAATPWSPPTAEQIGLIGTNWSKGWIIEGNTIQYSVCTGLTLGKHGDEFDNTMNYNRTIRIGLENGWNRDNIGSHSVINNKIRDCGQAAIVGSLGCAFSEIIGNEIYDIRQDHQFGGCETAGIKLHGGIDIQIIDNHVYRCGHWGGIWLDWMSQGARISGNLLHDNSNDFMFEMNHGPMLVDNNILLSKNGVRDASGGAAYVHNLIAGNQSIWSELTGRATPLFKPHSTDVIVSPKAASRDSGAIGGGVASFTDPVGNTEQGVIYQTVRYGSEGYRLDVPNGTYTVTLKFNEPFHGKAGSRRFGVTIQGKTEIEELDLFAKVGKNQAFDLVAESVRVEDGILNVGFNPIFGSPCIAGIEVVGSGAQPFIQRINCGGHAVDSFVADYMIMTEEDRTALWDQWGGIGFTVDQHDDQYLNNLFVKANVLAAYDPFDFEIKAEGNVYLAGAKSTKRESDALVLESFDPVIKLVERDGEWWLEMNLDPAWQADRPRALVTSELLGKAILPNARFEQPDGTPYRINADYFGDQRDADNPAPGPFRGELSGKGFIKVWPRP